MSSEHEPGGAFGRTIRACALAAALTVASAAGAHAYLTSSEPGGGTTLAAGPERVVLRMSEPVQLRFSRFAVVRLRGAPAGVAALREAARDLADAVFRDDDPRDRVDTGVSTDAARSDEIVLTLRPDLPAATYVVMWRVLSVDGHVTQEATWFHLSPESAP